jgi:hypothetical protein
LLTEHHTDKHACAACTIGCEHHYRTRDSATRVRDALRARLAVRNCRPQHRFASGGAVRRARDGRDQHRRHHRLDHGMR